MAQISDQAQTPSPAEKDLQRVLKVAQQAAEAGLAERPAMVPFAITMDQDGRTRQICTDQDHDSGSLIDQIEHLRQRLKDTASDGALRASAIGYIASVLDCESGRMQDAVAINLSHRDDLSTVIYFPFDRTDQKPKWSDSFQQAGRSEIFAWSGNRNSGYRLSVRSRSKLLEPITIDLGEATQVDRDLSARA